MYPVMHSVLRNRRSPYVVLLALLALLGIAQTLPGALPGARAGESPRAAGEVAVPELPNVAPKLDRSGRVRVGKASFYAARFGGRKMADGTPMRLQGNNAASKTLPLGTTAVVTNLETHRAATVTIRDRGPYVKGRIVDLSPAMAHQIGLEAKQGVAKVTVTPIAVPLAEGGVKLMAKNSAVESGSQPGNEWLD